MGDTRWRICPWGELFLVTFHTMCVTTCLFQRVFVWERTKDRTSTLDCRLCENQDVFTAITPRGQCNPLLNLSLWSHTYLFSPSLSASVSISFSTITHHSGHTCKDSVLPLDLSLSKQQTVDISLSTQRERINLCHWHKCVCVRVLIHVSCDLWTQSRWKLRSLKVLGFITSGSCTKLKFHFSLGQSEERTEWQENVTPSVGLHSSCGNISVCTKFHGNSLNYCWNINCGFCRRALICRCFLPSVSKEIYFVDNLNYHSPIMKPGTEINAGLTTVCWCSWEQIIYRSWANAQNRTCRQVAWLCFHFPCACTQSEYEEKLQCSFV